MDKNAAVQLVKTKIREFLYDTQVEDAEHMSELMGCTPISDDVQDREITESETRVEQISHLIPLSYTFCLIFSEAVTKHEAAHKDEIDKEQMLLISATAKLIMGTALPVVIATLSQLVDLGLLKVTKNSRIDKKRKKLW